MHRRELFRILAAGAMLEGSARAQHAHPAGAAADQHFAYQPRFFSEPEYRAIDGLADVIIPSDDQSPGAHVAGVAFYIDTVLHYADSRTQVAWRTGMTALEAAAQDRFGTPAGRCNRSQYEELVAAMVRHESAPATELDRFFVRLKQITIDGYFLSDIGRHDYLGYRGDTVLAEFPGCTHPEHQS
jgi:Gluconate 2-dehydrogenase subunit 3